MNPTLTFQDILAVQPYNQQNPRAGDVILFQPPSHDTYVVHRIAKKTQQGYLTIGDNNDEMDQWLLKDQHIYGRIIAAYQGKKRRKIAGGIPGRLTVFSCFMSRKINGLLIVLFRPLYRSLCTGGILHWLIPVRLTPQVAIFQSDVNNAHKLLLGKRIIGVYNESRRQWQIRRPYRILVDETSLPSPR